jgi:hypothetical protein
VSRGEPSVEEVFGKRDLQGRFAVGQTTLKALVPSEGHFRIKIFSSNSLRSMMRTVTETLVRFKALWP